MKNTIKLTLAASALSLFTACGSGDDDGGSGVVSTDNSRNQWVTQNSNGYTGGNVLFGGLSVKGEWSTTRTLNKSGLKDSFVSTDNYIVLGIKFDNVRYYEYWVEYKFVNGKLESNGAFTPLGGYGVSKDGRVLTVDQNNKSYTFNQKSGVANGSPCIIVVESVTADQYELCKVNSMSLVK